MNTFYSYNNCSLLFSTIILLGLYLLFFCNCRILLKVVNQMLFFQKNWFIMNKILIKILICLRISICEQVLFYFTIINDYIILILDKKIHSMYYKQFLEGLIETDDFLFVSSLLWDLNKYNQRLHGQKILRWEYLLQG